MTNQEINRNLALAIGYPADRVRFWPNDSAAAYVQVLNDYKRGDGPMDYGGWQRFDHRDTAVIWPIAEQFCAWPTSEFVEYWLIKGGLNITSVYLQGNATATAWAVIKFVEGKI